MKSTISSKFGRSSEKAKYSIDVKYVGEFSDREEATNAFSRAMSKIPPDRVLPADLDGSKVRFIPFLPASLPPPFLSLRGLLKG